MQKRFGQWLVDDTGLTHEPSQYFIEAAVIDLPDNNNPKVSYWALHVMRKTWVNSEEFVPAMKRALEHFAPHISWNATLKELQWNAYVEICHQEAARRYPSRHPGFVDFDGPADSEAGRLLSCAWRPRKIREPESFPGNQRDEERNDED